MPTARPSNALGARAVDEAAIRKADEDWSQATAKDLPLPSTGRK